MVSLLWFIFTTTIIHMLRERVHNIISVISADAAKIISIVYYEERNVQTCYNMCHTNTHLQWRGKQRFTRALMVYRRAGARVTVLKAHFLFYLSKVSCCSGPDVQSCSHTSGYLCLISGGLCSQHVCGFKTDGKNAS